MCAVPYAYNISVCKQVYPILTQVLPLCMRSWPIPITSTVKVGFLQTSQASTAPKTPRIITYYDNNKYMMFFFPHWEWLGCSQRNGQHSLFWCFFAIMLISKCMFKSLVSEIYIIYTILYIFHSQHRLGTIWRRSGLNIVLKHLREHASLKTTMAHHGTLQHKQAQ